MSIDVDESSYPRLFDNVPARDGVAPPPPRLSDQAEVHTENGIEGPRESFWRTYRGLFIVLALLALIVLGYIVWAGVSSASPGGGCGG